jgi:hypothetical protein
MKSSRLNLKLVYSRPVVPLKSSVGRTPGWVWIGDIDVLAALGSGLGLGADGVAGDDGLDHDLGSLSAGSLGCALGFDFAQHSLVQCNKRLSYGVTWLDSDATRKLADSCLPTSTMSGDLHLTKAGVLNVFYELVPVHAPILSAYRYCVKLFLSASR